MLVPDVRDDRQFDGVTVESTTGGGTAHTTTAAQGRVFGDRPCLAWRAAGKLLHDSLRDRLDEPDIFGLTMDRGLRAAGGTFRSVGGTFLFRLNKRYVGDEQALAFVPFASSAEAHDDCQERAVFARAPGQRHIASW